MKKLLKDMTYEELVDALSLEKRDGENKAKIKKNVNINININIRKEDIIDFLSEEETDSEFGRRVRYSFVLKSFRKRQEQIKAREEKKLIKKLMKKLMKK